MTTFEFTLRIDQRLAEEADMDVLYSKCPDSSSLVDGDVTFLHFQRDAPSLHDAIRSAITDINAAGHHVAHVELEPDSVTAQTA